MSETVEEINARLAAQKAADVVAVHTDDPIEAAQVEVEKINVPLEETPEITEADIPVPEVTEAPIDKGLPAKGLGVDAKVEAMEVTSTKQPVILTTGKQRENMAGPNAQAASANSSITTSVINPATGLSHNPFTWFYTHVLSKLPSLSQFTVETEKAATVVAENENSPEYAAAQAAVVKAALALASAASLAVSEKGINPVQDIATISLLENLVSTVHTYLGLLQTEYNAAGK